MCAKAMPATVYVAVARHLSEVKLCARACRGPSKVPGEVQGLHGEKCFHFKFYFSKLTTEVFFKQFYVSAI